MLLLRKTLTHTCLFKQMTGSQQFPTQTTAEIADKLQ
jgi:hypothetical protein